MTEYLLQLFLRPGHEGDLRAYLEALPEDALGVEGFRAFHKGWELLLVFKGQGARPWEHLFEGEHGHEFETQLRLHTNFEPDKPFSGGVPDLREAAHLPPEARGSPEDIFTGG